jgi:hypothetical protein
MILWVSFPMLNYLAVVVDWGGKTTGLEIGFNWYMLIGYYLILLYFLIKNKEKIVGN